MEDAYICDAVRTPIGRYGGALASVRADDLGALPVKALLERNPKVDWETLDDVLYGCANQAGEDKRNVARMSSLLAGLPVSAPGATINRLCGSGMDAVGSTARAIKAGEAQALAVMRARELTDDATQVNPNGGAIALGHPLGMSGAWLVTTAMYELQRSGGRYALCTMCIGVGQGIALVIEKV